MYGAVAGMVVDEEAAKLALQEGLYLLQQSGTAVEIANPQNFVPRKF
ncbi:MAG: hypothetical protein N2035_08890 [Chthoniobacterales bacterium]|nr:hypothetical protein [Chthoniobacterales bacterium]